MRLAAGGVAAFLLGALLAGCGNEGDPSASAADSLTRRERDSVIGASRLPGAPVVRRALQVSDTAAARAARIDATVP